MAFFKRIDKRLLFYYLVPAIISLSIVTFVAYDRGVDTIKQQTFNYLRLSVETAKSQIKTLIKTQKNVVREFATDRMIIESLEKLSQPGMDQSFLLNEMKKYLISNKMALYAPDILAVSILDNSGKVIFSTEDHEIGLDQSGKDYFVKVKFRGCFGDLFYSEIFHEPIIKVSAPIIMGNKSIFQGVIVNTISGSTLTDITRSAWLNNYNNVSHLEAADGYYYGKAVKDKKWLSSQNPKNPVDLYIVNRDKLVITDTQYSKDSVLKQKVDTKPVQLALNNGQEMVGIYNHKGVKVIGSSAFLEDRNWVILAESELTITFASIFKLRAQLITLAIITVGAILIISLIMARKLTGPIKRLIEAIRLRSKGNMDFRIKKIPLDELGILSSSFNQMCDDIQKITVSKDYTEKIFMGINESLFITDKKLQIKDANPIATSILGYDKNELVGKHLSTIIDETSGVLKSLELESLFKHNSTINDVNVIYKSKSGIGVPVNLSASVIRNCEHKKHPEDCKHYNALKGCSCDAINIVIIARDMRSLLALMQKEKERIFELTTIQEISKLLGYTLNYNDLFKIILNSLHKAVKFDIAGSVLCNSPNDLIYVKEVKIGTDEFTNWYKEHILETFYKISENDHKNCKNELVILETEDIGESASCNDLKKNEIKSFFNVPLMVKGNIIGVINISSFKEKAFTENHLRMLYTVANQTTISIQHLIASIEQEKGRLTSILSDMVDGVVVVDKNSVISMTNQSGEKFLKLLSGAKLGDTITRLADYSLEKPFKEILSGEKKYISTEFTTTIDFEDITTSLIISPFKEGEDDIGVVLVLRDVSQENKLRQQLMHADKLTSLGEMISVVAHEINNPLAGIMGFAQILQIQPDLDDKVRDKIDKIFAYSDRAKRIIQNLLTFARAHKPEKTLIYIPELIEQSFEILENNMRLGEIEVITNFEPGLPKVTGDRYQLQQVFFNIINNAYQVLYEYKGKRLFEMSAVAKNDHVSITFFNTGLGIPKNVEKKMFDPFFTTKKSGKGTGMGLSIAYGIIVEHGGSITIDNKIGEGVAFHIDLPIITETVSTDDTGASIESGSGSEMKIIPSIPKLNILVIDDEEAIVFTISEILNMEGHICDIAQNGKLAITKMAEKKYDLVICDIRMPEFDGKQVFAHVAENYPDLSKHFIIVTGEVVNPDTLSFLKENKIPYITKPFTMEEIKQIVVDVVEN